MHRVFRGNFSPGLRYNRVDELFAGLKYSIDPFDGLDMSVNGGYSTGYDDWSYGAGATYDWSSRRIEYELGIVYQAETAPRYQSQIISPGLSTVSNLLGAENYFDFLQARRI